MFFPDAAKMPKDDACKERTADIEAHLLFFPFFLLSSLDATCHVDYLLTFAALLRHIA